MNNLILDILLKYYIEEIEPGATIDDLDNLFKNNSMAMEDWKRYKDAKATEKFNKIKEIERIISSHIENDRFTLEELKEYMRMRNVN